MPAILYRAHLDARRLEQLLRSMRGAPAQALALKNSAETRGAELVLGCQMIALCLGN